MHYDNRVIAIGPGQLGYRIEGNGEHKLLLLHGLNSHSGTWRKTLPALTDRYTVVAPSLPPYTAKVSAALVELYSEHVGELARKRGMTDFTVIGSSLGGWIGMRLASGRRGMVSSLVLEDTAGVRSEEAKALEGTSIPILIIWGEDDEILALSEGHDLHSRLPGSDLKIVRGAKHVPHWEKPEEFNRLISDFLRRV